MKRFTSLVLGLMTASGLAYGFYRQQSTQSKLNVQLFQLNALLAADNADAASKNEGTLKGIQAGVLKNQNQPAEVAIWQAAIAWHAQVDSVVGLLHACSNHLLRATGNANAPTVVPHPNEVGQVNKLLGTGRPAQQHLQQQFAAYEAILRTAQGTTGPHLPFPVFDGLPTTAALASLVALESEVRAAERHTLQQAALHINNVPFMSLPLVFSSAESSIVAPRETYRARLFLVNALDARHLQLQMHHNGLPVPVNANNVGQVRFVAPRKPGPAMWTGTITFKANGRDTTFQVRVPYRVARR